MRRSTSSTVIAFGSAPQGARRPHLVGRVVARDALAQREPVEPPDGRNGPGRRTGDQGRMIVVALAQRRQEGHHIRLGDLADGGQAARGQMVDVTPQVTAV